MYVLCHTGFRNSQVHRITLTVFETLQPRAFGSVKYISISSNYVMVVVARFLIWYCFVVVVAAGHEKILHSQ